MHGAATTSAASPSAPTAVASRSARSRDGTAVPLRRRVAGARRRPARSARRPAVRSRVQPGRAHARRPRTGAATSYLGAGRRRYTASVRAGDVLSRTPTIGRVAYSPDGRLLATAEAPQEPDGSAGDWLVVIRDAATGRADRCAARDRSRPRSTSPSRPTGAPCSPRTKAKVSRSCSGIVETRLPTREFEGRGRHRRRQPRRLDRWRSAGRTARSASSTSAPGASARPPAATAQPSPA